MSHALQQFSLKFQTEVQNNELFVIYAYYESFKQFFKLYGAANRCNQISWFCKKKGEKKKKKKPGFLSLEFSLGNLGGECGSPWLASVNEECC
jgi:hypothetical protein